MKNQPIRPAFTSLIFRMNNYRGINISSNVGKLFTRVLAHRLEKDVDNQNLLREIQFGFRKNKRTTDALFILTQLIERPKKHDKKIALAFLDIKKAYDRVDRSLLWSILGGLGYGSKFARIMHGLYKDLQAKANLGSIKSSSIALNIGLTQGCLLSPLLFAFICKGGRG